MRGGTLGGALTAAVLAAWAAAAPAGAATYATTMDFKGTSLDCIVNNNLTGRAFYSHLNASNCHSLEASWRGPFYSSVWGAPICRQGPDDNRCSNWGYGCCMTCALVGNTNEHGSGDFNLGKPFAPGTYLQTLTVEAQVPGAPATVDTINAANLELYFSPTGFGDTGGCARQKVNAPAVLKTGDVWNIAVVIPDVGQTVRIDKDGPFPDNGDKQEGVADFPLKPFKVIVTTTVAGGAEKPVKDASIEFRLKDSAGTLLKAITNKTLDDGRTQAQFAPDDPALTPGDYTVEAACAGCAGGSPLLFTAKVLSLNQAAELRKHSASNGGVVGERLRNPLVVKVINRITNKPIKELSHEVSFELLPTPPCPAATSIDPQLTSTLGESATAQAHVKLGASTGNCRVRAHCNQCLAQPDVVFDLAIRPRPEFEMDGGEPGNPFSRSGGGPTTTTARRRNGQLSILYKLDPFGNFHRTIPATTESDTVGYIAALTGDTVTFLEPTLGETISWKDSFGFSATGNFTGRTYTTVADDLEAPVVMTAQSSKGKESVRVLIAQRPAGPAALDLLEEALYLVTVLKCFPYFPMENCIRALTSREAADKFGKDVFLGSGPGGGNCGDDCCNAGIHAFWHARAVSLTSVVFAYEMGVTHERETLYLEQEGHNALVMDLHNNSLGQFLGKNTPESALAEKVKNAITSGQALVFDQPTDKLSLLVNSGVCGKR